MTEMFGTQQTPTPESTGSISPSEFATSGSDDQSAKDAATQEARGVAQEGVQAGKHVVFAAADQATKVASEAGGQAQVSRTEAKVELMEHATSQKDRVAHQLHTPAHEFGSMASSSDQDGLASDLAQQACAPEGNSAPEPAFQPGITQGSSTVRPAVGSAGGTSWVEVMAAQG